MIRLANLQDSEDHQVLGDKTLGGWVGLGTLTFACYTATNNNGGGNPNQYQSINYGNDYVVWHYVYFGYSRE